MAVEVRAQQYDFIGKLTAGQFGDHVESVWLSLVVELSLDVQLDLDRDFLIQYPDHAVVMFDGQRNRRNQILAGVFARVRASGGHKDCAAVNMLGAPGHLIVAGDQESVSTSIEFRNDSFFSEEMLSSFRQIGFGWV